MAWYDGSAAVHPGQAYNDHLRLQPGETQPQDSSLTRDEPSVIELAVMLYEEAGKPSAEFTMDYTDVANDAAWADLSTLLTKR